MKPYALATTSIAIVAFTAMTVATPAQAITCGTDAVVVNTWNSTTRHDEFIWYDTTGARIETVEVQSSNGWGDIALSPDATTIYAMNVDIDVLDATTGALQRTIAITGPAAGIGGWVGATIIADGSLIIGSYQSHKAFKIDLATGASTEYVDYQLDDPTNTSTSVSSLSTTGDFAQLDNGDVLVLYTNGAAPGYFIARIHADGSMTTVGSLPIAYGMGRINEDLMLVLEDGNVTRIAIADIPTAAGTALLTPTQVDYAGQFPYGASGTQDSGVQTCATDDPPTDPTDPAGSADAGLPNTGVNMGALSALAAGLGLAGAAGVVLARRKRA